MLRFLWRVREVVTVKRNILRTGRGYRAFNLQMMSLKVTLLEDLRVCPTGMFVHKLQDQSRRFYDLIDHN